MREIIIKRRNIVKKFTFDIVKYNSKTASTVILDMQELEYKINYRHLDIDTRQMPKVIHI